MRGAKHLSDSQFADAEKDFASAASLDPTHPEYLQALVLAREHHVTDLLQHAAQQRGTNPVAADALLNQARKLDSSNPRVQQHDPMPPIAPTPKPTRQMELAGAIQLKPNSTRHSYHERNDLRVLLLRMASDYGIKLAQDPAMTNKQVRIDVDDANFDDAMHVLNLLSGTMLVPLYPDSAFVVADTTENRQHYEHLVEETFYLPGMTPDQIKDFVSIAQNVFSIKQVSIEPGLNALVMRGPVDLVEGADSVFTDLMEGTSDVVLDMKLYEVNKTTARNLGVQLPSSLSAYSLASEAQNVVSQNQSLISQLIASGVIPSTSSTLEIAAYLVFSGALGSSTSSLISNSFVIVGGGATTVGLSTGSIPTLNLALNNSDSRTLDDVQLRVGDRQNATFKTGTRYPIQTSLFSDIATSTSSALAGTTVNGVSLSSLLASYLGTSSLGSSATIPQIQYEDLGFALTATPRILRTADVGMHIEVKISSLAGTALNGIPVLTSRQFTSDLTIHDGETAMMISDVTDSETKAATGVPGLNELPGFQGGTNSNSTHATGDLVLMITPHIVHFSHRKATGPYIALAPRPDDD